MEKKKFDDEMRFALFRNIKGDNPKRPDYRGTIQINGVKYELSGWLKDSPKGKFISGCVQIPKPKIDADKLAATTPIEPKTIAKTNDDDVPF